MVEVEYRPKLKVIRLLWIKAMKKCNELLMTHSKSIESIIELVTNDIFL